MNNPIAFLQNIGPVEIIVIAAIVLLLFGNRLPSLARNLGKGITEFKKGVKEGTDEPKSDLKEK